MAQSAAPFSYGDGEETQPPRSGAVSVSIFADRPHLRLRLAEHVLQSGLRLRQRDSLDRLPTGRSSGEAAALGEIVLVDAPLVDAEIVAALCRLDEFAKRSGTELVISTRPAALDGVFGCIDQSGAQILVSPSDGERALRSAARWHGFPAGPCRKWPQKIVLPWSG